MNTFGPSDSQQFPLYDPRSVRENRSRFRRDAIPLLDRANSIYVPVGRNAVRGWILLARDDYNKIDTYNNSLELHIGDTRRQNNVGKMSGLSIVQARCVTRGLTTAINALYLVELTDSRGVLYNEWFQFPTTSSYNIRAPAYPQTFHPASMNGGTTWTWATMIQDLWQQMTPLGTWPGLPAGASLSGTPEGFWFVGVPAWTALCDVLDHLGLAVACDLTANNPYTIISSGANDAALGLLQTKYLTNLEDDLEWIDTGSGRVPKYVEVFFRRRNSVYGTEETVTYRSDGPYQWDMSPVYSVTVTAPSTFASAVGTHHLWSDFTVRYDMDNNPLSADVTTATAIAQERVTQYFDRIYSRVSGFMSQTYAGALPFTTGSQVDMVCWSQDYRSQSRHGWKTKIVRGNTDELSLLRQGVHGAW